MSEITKTFSLFITITLISILLFGQSSSEKNKIKRILQEEINYDGTPGEYVGASNFNYIKLVNAKGTKDILWDNGPFVTAEGIGSEGTDYSQVQDNLGMGTWGTGFQISAGNSIADDFILEHDYSLYTFTFFGYQTGSGPPSTLNDVRIRIWQGNPMEEGLIIWGNLDDNLMVYSEWTNCWRVTQSSPEENRPVMKIVADVTGLNLTPGTYWVEYTVGGTGASGPWAPYVTIIGETTTGNAIQNQSGAWQILEDVGPQGLPFIVHAFLSSGEENDLSVNTIIEPSGGILLGMEDVTINILNVGNETQSNFEVSYTVNGDLTVTEMFTGSIASLEEVEYTFATQADLSELVYYEIVACVNLVGDENPDNDCKTKIIELMEPSTCPPQYETGCSYGDGFTDFALEEIENFGSGCADLNGAGWSQYFELGPAVLYAGGTHTISMATGYNNHYTTVWIDFDNDSIFTEDEKVIDNLLIIEAGVIHDIDFTVPSSAMPGAHFMRARTNYNEYCLDPCDEYAYGEAEDYIITIAEGTTSDCQDFDDLQVGVGVYAQLGGMWTTWSGVTGTEDALVTDLISNSPNNSFVVDTGTIDLVFMLDDEPISTGQHLYSHYMYVPTGKSGYFNVQSEPTPGIDWVLDLFFDSGGTGSFGSSSTDIFTYEHDTWILVEINFDLSSDLAAVYFNGVLMTSFVWDSTIGGIDYFGYDMGGPPGAYYDDVCFDAGWGPPLLNPPTNLEVTIVDCQVQLTWDPPELKNLLGYNIYRKYNTGSYSLLGFSTEVSYMEGELPPCTAIFYYMVTAVYNDGESEPSNEALAEIPCYPPQNLAATIFENVNTHLICDPPVCGTPESYNFYRDGNLIGNNTIPEYDDLELPSGTYEYYSTAIWPNDESEPSNAQTVTIEFMLYAPTNLTGPDWVWEVEPINLTWDAPQEKAKKDFLHYNIYSSYNYDPFILLDSSITLSYSYWAWEQGFYEYYVTAIYDEGESDSTNHHIVDVIGNISKSNFSNFQVYPNPATNLVKITSDYKIKSIKVYSFTGQRVINELVNKSEFTIKTSKLEPGLYLFQIDTKEGITTNRIVIH